jgi:hypothetical protein
LPVIFCAGSVTYSKPEYKLPDTGQ